MPNLNFPDVDKSVLSFWESDKTFEKLIAKNKKSKARWSFIDGPVTANNILGIHHGWGRTYKDAFNRFHAMCGERLLWQNGFDCHGLWVEVEVEKELGFRAKKDIEEYGIGRFAEKCRERVNRFAGQITEQSKKLGQWNDWGKSYLTMDDDNVLHIWKFLEACHKRGMLYKGSRVMPWCTRCGTSLSQHELTDYSEETDESIYFGVQLRGKPRERLLAWTTTPWTIPANRAMAVHPDNEYAGIQVEDKLYWVSLRAYESNKLFSGMKVEVVAKGSRLVGMQYVAPLGWDCRPVIAWDGIDGSGTGIVHVAPGCGAEDYELGKENGLEAAVPIDESGNYVMLFEGHYTKVNALVQECLSDLFASEPVTHRVARCWRCRSRLVHRHCDEWFLSVQPVREQMKRAAASVKWTPSYAGELMQNWLDQMGDWCISRRRYWGLPLPFYLCASGHLSVVADGVKEKHRPEIDEVPVPCSTCGQEARRVPEVGDCWLDAGIAPLATLNHKDWPEERWMGTSFTLRPEWFPFDFATEMREQVRLWFYSSLFMSVVMEGCAPWRNVMTYEDMRNKDGEAFSKSKGNAPSLDAVIEKHGADPLRYVYAMAPLNQPFRFDERAIDDAKRKLLVFANCFEFYNGYAKIDDPVIGWSSPEDKIDRWVFSRLQQLIRDFRSGMASFNLASAMRSFEAFTQDLSWYVRVKRPVFADRTPSRQKTVSYHVMMHVLQTSCRVIAPVLPFLADHLHYGLYKGGGESVHLKSYPESLMQTYDEKLMSGVAGARRVIGVAMQIRDECKVKLRQPLQSLRFCCDDDQTGASVYGMKDLIMAEANVKDIIYAKPMPAGDEGWVTSIVDDLSVAVDVRVTPELRVEGYSRDFIRCVQDLRKKAGLTPADRIVIVSDVPQCLLRHAKVILIRCGAASIFHHKSLKNTLAKGSVRLDKDVDVEIVRD